MATDLPPLPSEPRFEELLGRFFDGHMKVAEDRAFAEMLAQDPELARRFLEQLSIEGMVAGLLGDRRTEEAAFVAGVRRALELTCDESETRHFAQRVVALAKRIRRPGRVRSPRKGTRDKILGLPPPVLGLASAAAILLLALGAWYWSFARPRNVPVRANDAQTAPTREALARLSSVDGLEVAWDRDGVQAPALVGDEVYEDDLLVITTDAADERGAAQVHAVVAQLRDGSKLIFSGPAALRFSLRGNVLTPLLEHGSLRVQAAPQLAGRALVVRTQQGPEAAVRGTVFRLHAEPDDRRVTLEVEEGQVRFTNQGTEQTVNADLACVALDGEPPRTPFVFRAEAARLVGKVLDEQSGAPVAEAMVHVVTIARRRSDFDREMILETASDKEGNFRFDALQEGPVVIYVKMDKKSHALYGKSGNACVLLKGGEKTYADVHLHKYTLLYGVITDVSGNVIPDCDVQALPEGSKGLVPRCTFAFNYPAHEFRAAVIHGEGTYGLQIEKKGHVVKTTQVPRVKVPPERAGALKISAKLEPSAAVRGRVLNAETKLPFVDAGEIYAPRAIRTILTLQRPIGREKALTPEADGSFVFDTALEAGCYELKVERFGCVTKVLKFDLSAGQTVQKDIILRSGKRVEHE